MVIARSSAGLFQLSIFSLLLLKHNRSHNGELKKELLATLETIKSDESWFFNILLNLFPFFSDPHSLNVVH